MCPVSLHPETFKFVKKLTVKHLMMAKRPTHLAIISRAAQNTYTQSRVNRNQYSCFTTRYAMRIWNVHECKQLTGRNVITQPVSSGVTESIARKFKINNAGAQLPVCSFNSYCHAAELFSRSWQLLGWSRNVSPTECNDALLSPQQPSTGLRP